MIFTSFLLGALGAFSPQQAEFSFEDATSDVELRRTTGRVTESYYTSLTFDAHTLGGSFVDLNGDGYPELVLPAQRANDAPEFQTEGGFVILANLPGPNFATDPTDRFFDNTPLAKGPQGNGLADTPFPGSRGHEVQGIQAADFNNDGKLDLLVVCGGTYFSSQLGTGQVNMDPFEGVVPGSGGPVDEPMRNLLFINFTETKADVENQGLVFDPGSFSFGLVEHNDLDPTPSPKDGYGIQYSQEPSSVSPYYVDLQSGAVVNGQAVDNKTIFPTFSSVAAVADMNRDGKLDLFIGSHHKSGKAFGFRNGQMNAIYLNTGNVPRTLDVQETSLGQFVSVSQASANVPQYAEVSYDRRNYPSAFPSLGSGDSPTDLIAWEDYLPIFGLQGRCNCPNSYILPCFKPEKRFSATNAAVFTDVNNDNWPDLILTNKGFGASPFQGPLHNPGGLPFFDSFSFLDSDMIYINRGVREVSPGVYKWLGFWNRTWDIMEKLPAGDFETSAPMGIAVADYDMDGDMDFFLNDVSYHGKELEDRFEVTTATDISMGGMFFKNETVRAETGMEQTDISFVPSGTGTTSVYGGGAMDLHGDFTVPMWFGWGATFGDFDMDGDEDLYCGASANLAPIDDDFGTGGTNLYLDAIFPGTLPVVNNTSPPGAPRGVMGSNV
ncbi:MAG: VCBS repeat-containing protein [Planctomycetota bacterium]